MKDKNRSHGPRHRKWTFWLFGLGSLAWLLLRSGTNPRRLAYPCQRSALAGGLGFVGYVTSLLGSAHLYQRLKRTATLTVIGLPVLVLLLAPLLAGSNVPATPVHANPDLPGWTSASAVSNVFAVPNAPVPECSLDGGTLPATPPCNDPSYALRDAGVDSLVNEMEAQGDYFYQTTAHPAGIVGADDVVVIKINNQWGGQGDDSGRGRLATNTDVLKGLIWRILQHPDGFSGEVVVAENTQDVLLDWDITPANAQDQDQSYQDVVDAFQGLGYAVSLFTWDSLGDNLISGGNVGGAGYPSGEYARGNYDDAYILLEDPAGSGTDELSYPKFRTAGGHYVSMGYGVWDGSSYDADRLTFINVPVLKRHGMAGATIAWKNLIGFVTIRDHDARYGSWDTMHDYFWGYTGGASRDYGLIGRQMALIRAPDLNVVDAIWVGIDDNTGGRASRQDILVASRDPYAVDWYASEYVLRPVAAWPEDASAARAGIFRDATRANQNAAASVWPGGNYPYIDLLDSYDGDTPSDGEKNQMNAYVVGGLAPATGTPTATATPTPTSTPTATPTAPASACLTDANTDGRVDVEDIMATAQELGCIVHLPLIARNWRQPWSALTATPTPTPTSTPTPTATPTTPPAGDLVQPADFTYLGAFRLPDDAERPRTFEYGGNAMTFNPAGDSAGPADGFPGSLFITGHDRMAYGELPDGSQVAEVSIPAPVVSDNPDTLPHAAFIQGFHDVAAGFFAGLDELPRIGMAYLDAPATGPRIHLAWGQHLQPDPPVASHAWFDPNLAAPNVQGTWFIGDQSLYSVNGYMFEIPTAWADTYASGRYLGTGRFKDGGWSGMGPALFAYRPWVDESGTPAPSGTHLTETVLLLYESSMNTDNIERCLDGYQHPDEWEGGAWITTGSGKAAVLFAGTKGTGARYWYGYVNPAGPEYPCVEGEMVGQFTLCRLADGSPCPPEDLVECEGHNDYRGWWSSRFDARFILYDPADLAGVVAGEMASWEPQPYAVLELDELLLLNPAGVEQDMLGTGVQRRYRIGDVAYDRSNDLLYVLELFADDAKPVVHVWRAQ